MFHTGIRLRRITARRPQRLPARSGVAGTSTQNINALSPAAGGLKLPEGKRKNPTARDTAKQSGRRQLMRTGNKSISIKNYKICFYNRLQYLCSNTNVFISMDTLDDTDLKILRAMQENCRLTTKELAQKIHLSSTPTFERLRRLERMGYIHKYVAVLDADKLERGFVVYCNLTLRQINTGIATEFQKAVQEWPEVSECYNVSGDCDFMLKVYVASMKQYQEFLFNKVGVLDYVSRIQSTFVMDTLKFNYGIPI